MTGMTNIFLSLTKGGISIQDISYFDSIYDSANDTVVLSGKHFAEGTIIVVSQDGGQTFEPIIIAPLNENLSGGGFNLFLVNDTDAGQYLGFQQGQDGTVPTIWYATHADPLTWAVFSTIDDLSVDDVISGAATDGAGNIVVTAYTSSSTNDLHISRSTDNGATWTTFAYDEGAVFDATTGGYDWRGLTYNGTHFAAHIFAFSNTPSAFITWVVVSDDAGATWSDVVVSETPPDAPVDFLSITAGDSGDFLLFAPDQNEGGEFRSALSADDGATWAIDDTGGVSENQRFGDILYDAVNSRYVTATQDTNDDEARIYVSTTTSGAAWTLGVVLVDNAPIFGFGPSTMVQSTSQNIYIVGGGDFGLYTVTDDFVTIAPAVQA